MAAPNQKIYDYKYEYPGSDIQYFKKNIAPIMESLRSKCNDDDSFMTAILSEMKKKGLTVNANTFNMIVDTMALYRIPQSAWDYISSQTKDNFDYQVFADIINSGIDLVQGKDNSPLKEEIKQRAKALYNPSFWESIGAVSATTLSNAAAELPLVIFTGGTSVLYDAAISSTNEVVDRVYFNSTQKLEHRKEFFNTYMEYEERKRKKSETKVPAWMLIQGLNGKTFETASDQQLYHAKKWADQMADIWWKRYEKVKDRNPDENGYVLHDSRTGKNYTLAEIFKKHAEYTLFSRQCSEEISSRKMAAEAQKNEQAKAEEERRKIEEESKGIAVTFDNLDHIDEITSDNVNGAQNTTLQNNDQNLMEADPWGIALSSWKKNAGFDELLKHPGSTIASIPDVLMGMFTGKIDFKSDMLMPLACMISGFFTGNSLLKVPLIMGGAASIVGKVANGDDSMQSQNNNKSQEPKYKKYNDVELDPRISNPQLNGNTLMLDIDHSPYIVAISSTAVDAYQKGALPLNVIANSVLTNLDQAQQPSKEQQQQLHQSIQTEGREQNIRIK